MPSPLPIRDQAPRRRGVPRGAAAVGDDRIMAEAPFRKSFTVRWADLDANGHMANTAYLDTCVDVRFGYFASRGLPAPEVARLGIGPVVRRDEVEYHRELRLLEEYTVDIRLAGISEDASRFSVENRFQRGDGELVARVVSTGGWLDLASRRLVAPPEMVRAALLAMPRAEDFSPLRSSLRSRSGRGGAG